jgi:hypothetical protein
VTTIRSTKIRDFAELLIGYGLILAVIWIPGPWQRILYWSAFAWITVVSILRRKDTESHGLGFRGLLASLWVVGVAVALAAAAVWTAARMHTLHGLYGNVPLGLHMWGYAVWALMQQFILQVYILQRLIRMAMPRRPAVALAAVLFMAAHIPNPLLMALTLVWGVVSCSLFLRYRNLWTLGLAHAILGICIAVTVPDAVHRHMRVGLGYLHYHAHRHHGHRTIVRTS